MTTNTKMRVFSIFPFIAFLLSTLPFLIHAETHRFEHCASWKKPSSESHRWSYERACNAALSQVEHRHGPDWKITDVEFEDKGRNTKTHTDMWGRRTWRCSHCVVAKYNVVRRGHEEGLNDQEYIVTDVKIRFKMRNPFAEVAESTVRPETVHHFEHCSSWSKPSSESHRWSYEGATKNCLAEVEKRHGVDWKITDLEFDDKGRTTKTRTDWTGKRTWKCTHCVVAKYRIVRRGHESSPEKEKVKHSAASAFASKVESLPQMVDVPEVGSLVPPEDIKETGHRFQQNKQVDRMNRILDFSLPFARNRLKKGAVSTETFLNQRRIFQERTEIPPIESFFFDLPESVCLPDERTQVTNTEVFPYSANCQLIINVGGGRLARGTGWLAGPRLIVTAGHCVHEGDGGDFFPSITIVPGMNGDQRPFGSQTVASDRLRASDSWKSFGSLAGDYGAIILDDEFRSADGEHPGVYSIQVLTDSQLQSRDITLSGYPGDKPFGTQWKDSDPIHRIQNNRLRYMLDTYGGQSGSVVVTAGETVAVGIHNYGSCPNKCTRIDASVKQDLDGWGAESRN